MQMKKIGFIGTGIMGAAMAQNLMNAGYQLHIYNRTKAKAQGLIDTGALWCDTPLACAMDADIVITMVGNAKDVEDIYFGTDGLIANLRPGTYLIDATTSSPALAARIGAEAAKKGLRALDAPVTGGDAGAKAGTLIFFVGGEEKTCEELQPVFSAMGKKVVYAGESGSGQHMKMCNQIAVAGALSGACEAIIYARAAGLDERMVLETIAAGAAGSYQLSNVVKRGVAGDNDPGFMMKHFVKDLNLADEAAHGNGLTLDVLEVVRDSCQKLAESGYAEDGTQILLKYYADQIAR